MFWAWTTNPPSTRLPTPLPTLPPLAFRSSPSTRARLFCLLRRRHSTAPAVGRCGQHHRSCRIPRNSAQRPSYGWKYSELKFRVPQPSWERYILVVEDDHALRDLYRYALRAAGYAVVGVEDGLDALRVMESGKPRAVVLDLA